MSLYQAPKGPSGDKLDDFHEDQWWFTVLEDLVRVHGDMEQRRALFVIRNLLATAAVTYSHLEKVQTALESSPHILHTLPEGKPCRCSQCEFVRLRDDALRAKGD